MKKALCSSLLALCLLCGASAQASTVKLTFAGDCTLGADPRWYDSEESFITVIEREGFAYPFSQVKHLFEADDLTLVNLEGVLKDDGRNMRPGVPFNFRGPTAYTEILRLGSIEAVNLSNNHITDYKESGIRSTKAALSEAGIGYCMATEAYTFEKDDVRIAFFGLKFRDYNANREWFKQTIPELKANGTDFVVIQMHEGEEYSPQHAGAVQEMAHRLIDLGADLIVAHHPHVLQGIEIYQNRTILYSLGNFAFGGNPRLDPLSLPTMIVQVTLEFDKAGYLSQQLTIVPAHSSGTDAFNDFRPVLVGGAEAEHVLALIQADTAFPLAPYVEGKGAVQKKLTEAR